MEHLQDNLRTYSPLEPLTDEEKEFLEETAQLMLKLSLIHILIFGSIVIPLIHPNHSILICTPLQEMQQSTF